MGPCGENQSQKTGGFFGSLLFVLQHTCCTPQGKLSAFKLWDWQEEHSLRSEVIGVWDGPCSQMAPICLMCLWRNSCASVHRQWAEVMVANSRWKAERQVTLWCLTRGENRTAVGSLYLHVMDCENRGVGYHSLTPTTWSIWDGHFRVTLGCFGLLAAVKSAVYVDAGR